MIKFGEGLPADRPVAFGTFGEKDLAAIRKLEATAEVWKKWFTKKILKLNNLQANK